MTEHEQQPFATVTAGWPRIHAVVHPDGTGAITVNGATKIIAESSTDATRATIVAAAADTARKIGRPVRMTTTDPEGQWWLVISPDGQVQAEPPPKGHRSRPMDADLPPVPPESPSESAPDASDHQPPARHAATEPADDTGPAAAVQPVEEPVPARARSATSPAEPEQPQSWADGGAQPFGPPADSPYAPAPPQPATPPNPQASPASAPNWPPQAPASSAPSQPQRPLPTLDDLLGSRPTPPPGPAEWGWQATMRHLTFGLVRPQPGPAELRHRSDVAAVQRSLAGPRTIVVVNPKGGAHKTTATMLIAATFGVHRGGYTLAWDNNETRGTLGWRAVPARHTNTAVNLLADLDRFDDPIRARIGDLDNYVRSQGSAQFDVLASDEDAGASASIEATAFRRLHAALSRFYRIMVIDTGNNMRASNWGAAVEAADQLVIVSTVREDTAASAAWLVDGLRSRLFEDKVANAVVLLSSPSLQPDLGLQTRLHEHFGQLTRAVIDVPYDSTLVDGAAIDVARLQPATREAWLHATAVIAEGL